MELVFAKKNFLENIKPDTNYFIDHTSGYYEKAFAAIKGKLTYNILLNRVF